MKAFAFYNCFLFVSSLVFCQTDTTDLYKKSLEEILKTSEYNNLGDKKKSFHVSEEILYYELFSRFFEKELSQNSTYDINVSEVVDKKLELLNLNKKNCSKKKIYFSEIKNNTFFAEIFLERKKKIKYSERSIFGISYVFLFKIDNKNIVLIDVKKMHYN